MTAGESDEQRTPIYDAEFAADPAGVYERLRARYGDYAPVDLSPGVPATLVLGYDAALGVLRDPENFPKNPQRWQRTVPPGSPVLPIMAYRPNALCTDGDVHARVRGTITDAFERVDTVALREYVEQSADLLIDRFAAAGEADLHRQYSMRLPLLVFNRLFGCPPDIADRLVRGMIGIFDLVDAENANAMLTRGVAELIALKREQPGADITSWMTLHPAGLTDQEMIDQLVLLMGAGTEPQQNLISNTLRLLLSDARFAGDLSGGSMPVDDALDEVLWTDPPMANFGFTYPRRDIERDGYVIPADRPVAIAYKAANTDPSKRIDQRAGNRAHLAYSAGPHTCPVKSLSRLIASAAIEKLLDRLPELGLAVSADKLQWRPGPFHRALVSLPVTFTPVPVLAPTPEPPSPPSPYRTSAPPPVQGESRLSLRSRLASWWGT